MTTMSAADGGTGADNPLTSLLVPGTSAQLDTSHSVPADRPGDKDTEPLCHKLRTRNVLTFSVVVALCFLTQINFGVFMVTQVTSLEQEFGFTSLQSGHILSSNEIGYLLFVLPSGYLATRLHVPRAMAVSALCYSVMCVVSGLPHFIFTDTSDSGSNSSSLKSAASVPPALCLTDDGETHGEERCVSVTGRTNNTFAEQSDSDVVFSARAYPVFVWLVVCQVVRGAMGACRFPLFTTYIESNSRKSDTGFYLGIVAGLAMLGPAIAFLVGGAISKVHVSLQPTDLTPTHPEWVGAWWLGFLLFGAMTALPPTLLWVFPRSLPPPSSPDIGSSSSRDNVDKPEMTPSSRDSVCCPETRSGHRRQCTALLTLALQEVRGFTVSVFRLSTNPVLVFVILSSCCFGFAMNGTYIFMPKYLQQQFQLPAWKANFIMGGAELTMGTSGFLLGGWLTRRLKLSVVGLYRLMIAITVSCLLVIAVLMAIGCPQPYLTGHQGLDSTVPSNNSDCNLSCSCPVEAFPVCDNEAGVSYFSPCHAGCSDVSNGVYSNCSCTTKGHVEPGQCHQDCTSVYYFSLVMYCNLFLLSLGGPVGYLLLVRSVSTSQVGLAMSMNGFATGLAGFMIGPMVFGALIDSFCRYWKTPCGARGKCSVYDNHKFRVYMHLYCLVAMAACLLFYLLSYLCYRCQHLQPPRQVSRTGDTTDASKTRRPASCGRDGDDGGGDGDGGWSSGGGGDVGCVCGSFSCGGGVGDVVSGGGRGGDTSQDCETDHVEREMRYVLDRKEKD